MHVLHSDSQCRDVEVYKVMTNLSVDYGHNDAGVIDEGATLDVMVTEDHYTHAVLVKGWGRPTTSTVHLVTQCTDPQTTVALMHCHRNPNPRHSRHFGV